MTAATADGRPAQKGERANSALAAGFALKHRLRAILRDVFERGARDRETLDRLFEQFREDPKAFITWMNGLLPADPVDKGSGNTFNLNQLFLDAVRNHGGAPIPVEHTPLPILEAEAIEAVPETEPW